MIGILWANMELGRKMLYFISQWNFCNFISQPSKPVIKMMVKVAFGNVGIILAGICPLNLFSLRRHGVSYPVKASVFCQLLLSQSQFLCASPRHLFLAPSASLLISSSCGSSQILVQRLGMSDLKVFCSLCMNTVILSQKYFISQDEIWKELCCALKSTVIYQFINFQWWYFEVMVWLEKHRFWLDHLLEDEEYSEESDEYSFKTIFDNLIIAET